MRALPEPVERVARYLRESGTEARIEEYSGGTPTAEDAARAAGASLEQIVKSLVFVCDGRYVLVLTPGDRRADPRKVASATGAGQARIASPTQVEEATGFAPGAVAPFPLTSVELVLLDRRLLVHDQVWVGAGSPRHLAAVDPADLARLTRGRAVDVTEDAGP
ncbi:MAG: YbaK/EbsC family protein [Thermoleophilia bacterium]|nr:YbaK/EbsC family protein [Thermoleophilia bacterium]